MNQTIGYIFAENEQDGKQKNTGLGYRLAASVYV